MKITTAYGNCGKYVRDMASTFMGVYLPCLLNIFGAILFLRLPWAVGQAGVLGALLTFAVAGVTVVLTILSIAAISTNGLVKGGGAYFMISRSLGPEFGGAVGLVFFAANSVGITFYLVAFAEEVDSLVSGGANDPWMIRLYASSALIVLLCLALVGANIFTKFNFLIFTTLTVSIVSAIVSFLGGFSHAKGYTGPNLNTLRDNLWVHYTTDTTGDKMSFFRVLIIIFPAMTGVMAGANMSGDLANPGRSIGRGTLAALFTAIAVYAALIVCIGATVRREALDANLSIMQDVAYTKAIIAMGLVSSTVSSSLASLVGSGRILQALARDNLFPFLRPFAWGTRKGDEPVRAILLAWVIAQSCIFIGNLDVVASIISEFFLLVYLFTNVACFALRITGAPNFRPRFKYFSWHTALLGAIACLVILFLASPLYASVSIVLLVIIFVYIHFHSPEAAWGDVSQAIIYHQVRKYLLRLDERKTHVKNWRPSILLFVQHPASAHAQHLIDFCNNLKKGGVYILGSVLVGELHQFADSIPVLRKAWLDFADNFGLKAFAELAIGPTARIAFQNLTISSGLGGMKPNTVVMPFPENGVPTTPLGETRNPRAPPIPLDRAASTTSALGVPFLSAPHAPPTITQPVADAPLAPEEREGGLFRGALRRRLANRRRHAREAERAALTIAQLHLEEATLALSPPPIFQATSRPVAPAPSAIGPPADGQGPGGTTGGSQPFRPDGRSERGSIMSGDDTGEAPGTRQVEMFTLRPLASRSRLNLLAHHRSHSLNSGATPESEARLEVRSESEQTSLSLRRLLDAADDTRGPLVSAEQADRLRAIPPDLPVASLEEYFAIVEDVHRLGRNLLVTRGFDQLDKELIMAFRERGSQEEGETSQMRIDVWATPGSDRSPRSNVSLALQLAAVLRRTDIWQSHTTLRLVSCVETPEEVAEEEARLQAFLLQFRFDAEVRVLALLGGRPKPVVLELQRQNAALPAEEKRNLLVHPAAVNELIRHNCEDTCVLFLPMPPRPRQNDPDTMLEYWRSVDALSQGLPPTVLVHASGTMDFVTDDL